MRYHIMLRHHHGAAAICSLLTQRVKTLGESSYLQAALSPHYWWAIMGHLTGHNVE